ncbi:MAG: REP element-mobilizing transposase RayT [Planctomycetota bacterium]|jgi:REP element-mobilizing transposase RayT
MPRPPRNDEPGAWFHVMNRGLARRTVFTDRRSNRTFLALLARQHRAGRIEVHSYCLLPTHFHLLLRSPQGSLSEALRIVQNTYVRTFNRRARRDGPLFKGRFLSKRIDSLKYRIAVVRYIDANPVAARLVARAERFPFGSAAHLAKGRVPPWLTTDWVNERMQAVTSNTTCSPSDYLRAFPRLEDPDELAWVERRLHTGSSDEDPLLNLVDCSPQKVRCWMERKARLADGTTPGLPSASRNEVAGLIRSSRAGLPPFGIPHRSDDDLWHLTELALLREFTGLTWSELAQHAESKSSTVRRQFQEHTQLLAHPAYHVRFSELIATLFASQ